MVSRFVCYFMLRCALFTSEVRIRSWEQRQVEVDSVPLDNQISRMDVSFLVVFIFFSSYPHIPARYLCRYCLLAFRHCTTLSVWLCNDWKQTRWLINGIRHHFHSMLIKGAAVFDCELSVVRFPPVFLIWNSDSSGDKSEFWGTMKGAISWCWFSYYRS